MSIRGVRWIFFLFIPVLLAPIGCGSGGSSGCTEAEKNIHDVAVLCGTYASRNQGKLPPSLDELKKFAKSAKNLPLTVTDQMFISPRDNQPFVLVSLERMPVPGSGKTTVIVYEKTGSGGRRYVADPVAKVEEVDEATFKTLVPNAK